MTMTDKVANLLTSAMQLSETHSQAKEATKRAMELQNNDKASAISAWNDLYEELVEITQNTPSAQDSKLGLAFQKSI